MDSSNSMVTQMILLKPSVSKNKKNKNHECGKGLMGNEEVVNRDEDENIRSFNNYLLV